MIFSTNKLSKILGLEIKNLDLREVVKNKIKLQLQKLFIENSILVVRNQELNAIEFQKCAEIFGDVFKQHNSRFSIKENPLVHYISNQDKLEDGKIYIPGEGFHTDHSNDANPPKATILLAKELPSYGGDTQFVNMNKLYENLPLALRKKIKDLKAKHVYQSKYSKRKLMNLKKNINNDDKVIHPLIRTHPETGLKSLYINPIRIENIINYNEQQTIDLLNKLMEFVKSKKYEYRHKWKIGDFVIWDNRILMHKANGDYDMKEDRYLFRIMIQNEIFERT